VGVIAAEISLSIELFHGYSLTGDDSVENITMVVEHCVEYLIYIDICMLTV
jgi:hypothetical protein